MSMSSAAPSVQNPGGSADLFAGGPFGVADARHNSGQWAVATTPRGLDARSMSSMMYCGDPMVPDNLVHGGQWHQADVGTPFLPQPEHGPMDHRRASAWQDINASFVV